MTTKKALIIITVLAILFSALIPGVRVTPQQAYADSGSSYTATLRYYDSIMLTYRLNYPSGGIWSGSGDVPVGGMGVSSQIYCADPFVPFHSMATTTWDAPTAATLDRMDGYVVAAPWAASATVQQHDDALRWLVWYGYRGDYLANDATSIASVARLNARYPGIGPVAIDKKIALMATKVALWKLLVGDSFTILKTSLTANQQITFDRLVAALISDATTLGPADKRGTELVIEIDGGGLPLSHSSGGFDFFGPLTVTASLEDSIGGDIQTTLNDVFLTVSGPDSASIEFVDALDGALPSGTIYGTSQAAPYLESSGFWDDGGVWTSAPFFLKVPADRLPPGGGHLTIQAFARAHDVPLMAGTPLLFVFENGGVFDWNYVQAFIGAANDGMWADLYAQARLRTSDLGSILVLKSITGASPFDEDNEFTFRLFYSSGPDGYDPITDVVDLSDCIVSSAASVDLVNNTFTLKNGGAALIDGLPMTGYYWVEELLPLPSIYGVPKIDRLVADGAPYPTTLGVATGTGFVSDAFKMDDEFALVRFTNTKDNQKAHLYVGKVAMEYFSDGREPEMILDTSYSFALEASADGGLTWSPVDLTDIFKSDTGLPWDALGGRFTLRSMDMALIEVDPALIYRIAESDPGAGYIPMYALLCIEEGAGGVWDVREYSAVGADFHVGDFYATAGVEMVAGGYYWLVLSNLRVTVCDLTVSKTVAGGTDGIDPDDIDPDQLDTDQQDPDQLFYFELFYMDHNLGLLPPWAVPLSASQSGGAALLEGVSGDRIFDNPDGVPSVFALKDGEAATIRGLPAGSYMLREIPSAPFTVTYTINAGPETDAQNGGDTETFMLLEDSTVAFTNTRPGKTNPPGEDPEDPDPEDPEEPDNPGGVTPRTGDNMALLSLVACVLCVVFAATVFAVAGSLAERRAKKEPFSSSRRYNR